MQVIRATDCPPVPWANGGGVTRELTGAPAAPAAPSADPAAAAVAASPAFAWRLSLADIDRDGPFSRLPGVDRVFAPLEGAVALAFADGRLHRLDAAAPPLAFDGAAAPRASLPPGTRCRALNLMLARGCCDGAMRRVALADGEMLTPDWASRRGDGGSHACFVQSGRLACGAATTSSGALVTLDADDPPPRALGDTVLLEIFVTSPTPSGTVP